MTKKSDKRFAGVSSIVHDEWILKIELKEQYDCPVYVHNMFHVKMPLLLAECMYVIFECAEYSLPLMQVMVIG